MNVISLQIKAEVRIQTLAGIFALCWENTFYSHASRDVCPSAIIMDQNPIQEEQQYSLLVVYC